MGHVKTWLTGIGLGYAVPNFEAAGIVTPSSLAELNVAHFEGLGVENPDDRRKLFFLVQRIKMAAKNGSSSSKKSSAASASGAASQATDSSTTAATAISSNAAGEGVEHDENQVQTATEESSSSQLSTTQDQVEQVLAKTSSLLDEDEEETPTSSDEKDGGGGGVNENDQAKSTNVVADPNSPPLPPKILPQENSVDMAVQADEDSILASEEAAAKAEETGVAAVSAETPQNTTEEEDATAAAAEAETSQEQVTVETVESKDDAAGAAATEKSTTTNDQDDDQAEDCESKQPADSPSSGTSRQPKAAAAAAAAPKEDPPTGGATGSSSAASCCGKSTVSVVTTNTISTSKSRGPPSPESAAARKKPLPARRGGGGSSSSHITSQRHQARRKMSKLTTPVRRPVSSTVANADRSSIAAAPSLKKLEAKDDFETEGEEKKQDASLVEQDEYDSPTEMDNNSILATTSDSANSSPQSSRRASKRLVEKQRAAQKTQRRTPATGARPRTSLDGTSRQSGLPAPKGRRNTRSSSAAASAVPKSARTGKELSAIPSESIAPMSPLIDLTDQQDGMVPHPSKQHRDRVSANRRSAAAASRRTLSDSESEESIGSSGRQKNNRRHSVSVERSSRHRPHSISRASESNTSNSPRRRQNYRRRHSEMISNSSSRQRAMSMSSGDDGDDAVNTSVLSASQIQYQGGSGADISFDAQIAALRDDNDLEHELFATALEGMPVGVGADSDEEDLMRIRVVVRKRPMSRAEVTNAGDIDVIHPLDYGEFGRILTYQPKTRVDLTKEIETIPFAFDNVFDEYASNVQIYERSVRNLIPSFFDGQWATISAYGQTGSGKTFTMMGSNLTTNGATETENLGLYYLAALDIFQALKTEDFKDFSVAVSLFEIYGGKLYDLINGRAVVKCMEDSKGKVCFPGLTEHGVGTPDELMGLIEKGSCCRSTGTTSRNADSSRSHAVLQLHLRTTVGTGRRKKSVEHSRLSFVDLAGNERGADTYCSDRATRMEGAEINTSLLALKEVIRALATGGSMTHVPFRGSKLTQVLKQSFVGKNCRSIMIACISPNIGNCEQTLNTLRYANRVKERNPLTGELSIATKGNNKNRRSSSVRKSLSQLSDTLCGGLSSVLDDDDDQPPPPPPPSSSDQEQSEGGNTTDMLDELLASPSPGVTDSEGPIDLTNTDCVISSGTGGGSSSSSKNNNNNNNLLPVHPRHAVRQLLTEHEAAIPVLLNMLQDEMALVSEVGEQDQHGGGGGCGIEEYMAQLDGMHENQLEVFAKMRDLIQAYRDARQQGRGERGGGNTTTNSDEILSDDGSFEDLRD